MADTLDLHLPQVIQSGNLEARRIELDRPITEDTEETGNFDVDMPSVQSRIHSDFDSAESTADSDLEDGELRKMLASLYAYGRGRPTASGKPEAKIMPKRGASADRTRADHS